MFIFLRNTLAYEFKNSLGLLAATPTSDRCSANVKFSQIWLNNIYVLTKAKICCDNRRCQQYAEYRPQSHPWVEVRQRQLWGKGDAYVLAAINNLLWVNHHTVAN